MDGCPHYHYVRTHYVSRMSTAVLAGANMSEWIAQDSSSYIDLAIENAACISALRDNRAHWRYQLQDSPLGDAEDLMHQLEAAFCQMHSEALSRA